MQQGLIYIFTGDGKGKTSAALGVTVRAVCAGFKVAWIAWYKENTWDISEKKLPEILPVDFYLLGKGFYIRSKIKDQRSKTKTLNSGVMVIDHASDEEHRQAALQALEKAKELLMSQQYDLLVCDEINNAISDKLLTVMDVVKVLEYRGRTNLVLTGRNAAKEIISKADLVTQMQKVKHPYDIGIKAVKGLDF